MEAQKELYEDFVKRRQIMKNEFPCPARCKKIAMCLAILLILFCGTLIVMFGLKLDTPWHAEPVKTYAGMCGNAVTEQDKWLFGGFEF